MSGIRQVIREVLAEFGLHQYQEDEEMMAFKMDTLQPQRSKPIDPADDWEDEFTIPTVIVLGNASMVAGNMAANLLGLPQKIRTRLEEELGGD